MELRCASLRKKQPLLLAASSDADGYVGYDALGGIYHNIGRDVTVGAKFLLRNSPCPWRLFLM